MIKGLKFTQKGGEGSGHHGHAGGAGGPDNPGGSTSSRLSSEMNIAIAFAGNISNQDKLKLLAATKRIPAEHSKRIDRIYIGTEARDKMDEENHYTTSAMWMGMGERGSSYNTSRLFFDTNRIVDIHDTIAHEVGHHVQEVLMGNQQKALWDSLWNEANERYFIRDIEDTYDMGLRKYSYTDKSEFFADTYSNWIGANHNDDEKWYNNNFRKFEPKIAEFMDSIFKEVK